MTRAPAVGFHRLRSLRVIGGFLDGQHFDLADGLTCFIGARGTGKTTVLELIRYAMDVMPPDAAARKRIESLVSGNLQGGRIELDVETKEGLRYTVTRTANDAPVVLNEQGSPTTISLQAGGLFSIAVFSQNEIEQIADRPNSQLSLIDDFQAQRMASVENQLRSLRTELDANASRIGPLEQQISTIGDELNALPSVEEKLKAYSEDGGENAAAINIAHQQKALRDREQRAVQRASTMLREHHQQINTLIGDLQRRLSPTFTDDMLRGPNHVLMAAIQRELAACSQDVDRLLSEAASRLDGTQSALVGPCENLDLAHKQQDLEFRNLVERQKSAQGRAAERVQLEKMRNALLAKQHERDELQRHLASLQSQRTTMLQRLSELRDQRFQIRQETVSQLNAALAPTIRITITQFGDPSEYRALLEESLSHQRLQRKMVAVKVVNAFWPAEVAELVRCRDLQSLVDKADLNIDQAEKFVAALSGSRALFDLQAVDLVDLPCIELNDSGTYKETTLLSTGQKCTSILPILLMHSDRPLLIDQPEDNLDNRFVFETVVNSIAKMKRTRQLMFVTHNPNIPVLGEADKVIVLESDGTSARKANEGTIDQCKEQIVTLLEGGEDAFKRRKERYAY